MAFASEIKALLQVPDIPRRISFTALQQYLTFLWVPDPLTMFEGIYKLPAGHYAVFKDGVFNLVQYWDLSFPDTGHNPHIDKAICCDAAHLPFDDAEFDLVFSDYVFEDLPDPTSVTREIYRVLKPGGYFLLRTPNKWHYVSLLAALVPDVLHGGLIERFAGGKEEDVFPKFFRCNTEKAVRHASEQAGFVTEELPMIEKEPSHLTRSPVFFRMGVLYERLVNSTDRLRHFRSNIFGVFSK